MTLRRLLWTSPLILAVACGDGASDRGNGGGGGLGGSAGGTGGIPSGGGTGGGGGSNGGAPPDPALECPTKPYAVPPAALVTGNAPALVSRFAIASEQPEGVDAIAALPGGDLVVAIWKRTLPAGSESATVTRVKPDGSTVWSRDLDVSSRVFIGAGNTGTSFVAGISAKPFTLDGITIGGAGASSTGYIYVLELDAGGALIWSRSFALVEPAELRGFAVSASGELALGGSLLGSIDFGGSVLAVPSLMQGSLKAAFVARLSPLGAHVWSRLYPTTGVHGDPPPLSGAGGTNGLGHSATQDVAWGAGDSLLATIEFYGAIDLGLKILPNDDLPDAAVVQLDAKGSTMSVGHVRSMMGEAVPPSDGGGGIAGWWPDGRVTPSRVALYPPGGAVVTGVLQNRAIVESVVLDPGEGVQHFTAVFAQDGSLVGGVPDGGRDVVADGVGNLVFWDDTQLVSLQLGGAIAWSRKPGGKFVSSNTIGQSKPNRLLLTSGGLLLAGSFVGQLDLGGALLEAAGCADAFVARFAP